MSCSLYAVVLLLVVGVEIYAMDPLDALAGLVSSGLEEAFDEDGDLRTYNTKFWSFDSSSPVFPEGNANDQSVGVAFSGGGTRSMVSTMGQLRGLKASGALNKVTHTSSTSGGGWASSIWHFATTDSVEWDDELLNLVARPEDLTQSGCESPQSLENSKNNLDCLPDGNIGKVATELSQVSLFLSAVQSFIQNTILSWFGQDISLSRLWAQWIRNEVLEPFGISASSSTPWLYTDSEATKQTIHTHNTHTTSETFDIQRTSRPFWINNGAYIPDTTNPHNALPFESTPMYSGTPGDHSGKGCDGQDLGGGWMEGYAFDSQSIQSVTIQIDSLSAKDLEDEDSWGTSDPYVEIFLSDDGEDEKVWYSTVVKNEEDPEWSGETFTLTFKYRRGAALTLRVWDEDFGSDDFLGKISFKVKDLPTSASEQTSDLEDVDDGKLTYRLWISAFGAELTDNNGRLRTHTQARQYTLGDVVGDASMDPAFEAVQSQSELVNVVLPRHAVFSPVQSGWNEFKNAPAMYNFIDGGSLENTAVIPLLVRNIKRVISFVNSAVPITMDGNDIVIDRQVAALFGYQEKQDGQPWKTFAQGTDSNSNTIMQNNQVFASNEFQPLLTALKNAKDDGKPLVYHKNITVQPNAWFGVSGNYDVNIAFFYNDINGQWKSRLPAALQEEVTNSIENFPNYQTSSQLQLSEREVNYLANMWQTTLLQDSSNSQEDIMDILQDVTGDSTLSAPVGFNSGGSGSSGGGSSSLADDSHLVQVGKHFKHGDPNKVVGHKRPTQDVDKAQGHPKPSPSSLHFIFGGLIVAAGCVVVIAFVVKLKLRQNHHSSSFRLEEHAAEEGHEMA